ncbi:MAG: HAMP domain-containing histidine kinase [Actinomycetota bacterium]|nr:HAMP domain-containing histidine kinase [Actinomycetota bacterium]
MSLRRRLALLSAAAVAVTVLLASAIVYVLVRDSLRDDVDDELRGQAEQASERIRQFTEQLPPGTELPAGGLAAILGAGAPPGSRGGAAPPDEVLALPPPRPGGPAALGQFIDTDGDVVATPGTSIMIPVSEPAKSLAESGGEPRFEDVEAGDTPLRVLTKPLEEGVALQVAASLRETEDTLSTLVLILVLVSGGGVALAAALGPVVARTALAPAREVSDAAREVARTRDLTRRIEVRGDDELGRLSSSFNEMMAALERSEASQRRLVADASHELRTPLAVLRTNIETLGRADEMSREERGRLVADVTGELEELTALVSDVVELAREPGRELMLTQDIALDELTRDAVERARRRFRELSFEERISPGLVSGDPQRIGRAISNLLDNAAKWSPAGGTIEVEAEGGRVSVRDHGPGFPAGDLPKVFDRFWRSDEARGKQGSGLGLAIVQRVAEEHGGTATAANAEYGGAVVSIEIPASEPQEGS